ncbi:hypothetical protein [Deinococcus enclensis]|uniref:YD repeat-containing protein n=2 Tax=Deinococcus TaxID=1298 RepID=A0ABT9MIC3_9DEIO|nr:hypothetical protein [Deinococcus enclensis]MDP9766332.1 hypothetical protein [Deinococcus enclensis]
MIRRSAFLVLLLSSCAGNPSGLPEVARVVQPGAAATRQGPLHVGEVRKEDSFLKGPVATMSVRRMGIQSDSGKGEAEVVLGTSRYDVTGRLLARDSDDPDSVQERYVYEDGRLTRAVLEGVSEENFSYDSATGNLTESVMFLPFPGATIRTVYTPTPNGFIADAKADVEGHSGRTYCLQDRAGRSVQCAVMISAITRKSEFVYSGEAVEASSYEDEEMTVTVKNTKAGREEITYNRAQSPVLVSRRTFAYQNLDHYGNPKVVLETLEESSQESAGLRTTRFREERTYTYHRLK